MNFRTRTRRCRLLKAVIVAGIIALAGADPLVAQATGAILGTVTDQTDARLPDVQLTILHVDTWNTRTTVSGPHGGFHMPSLAVGTYEITASLTGFQTQVRVGITLTIGREAVVDFVLPVGNVIEQVVVTGEAPLIETTTATVGSVVDSRQMRATPLNNRSFIELAQLQTGTVLVDSANSNPFNGFGRKLSITGQRYNANSFLLDGADINDAAGGTGSAAETLADVETVREFKVITNAYDAEYGRHTGGVISAVTRSGTSEIHGSLFEFPEFRNDNWDARNFFDVGEPPEFKRNQFGGSLGTPVTGEKLFLFTSYEALRESQASTNIYTVPSQAVHQGWFFGNPIEVDAAIRPYMDAYPLPNGGIIDPNRGRYISAASAATNQDYINGRLDHALSADDSLMAGSL